MIFKNKRTVPPYTQIHNGVINDPGLSGKAKWILIYLLSKPETWQVREDDILRHCTDGRDGIRAGIRELIRAGYIIRSSERVRDEMGHLKQYEYAVFDQAQIPDLQEVRGDNSYDGFSNVGKPVLGTIYSNKDISKREKVSDGKKMLWDRMEEEIRDREFQVLMGGKAGSAS